MRPAPDHSHPTPAPGDALDRIWAATRPDDPSPAMMDALWASAARELDRIEAGRNSSSGDEMRLILPARRRRVLAWVALAQAAAILIAAGVILTRRGPEPARMPEVAVELVRPKGSPLPVLTQPRLAIRAESIMDVPVGQTLLKSIDKNGYTFLDNPTVGHSIPDWTEHDVFDAVESRAAL